jgi:hypothetical protein
MVTKLWTVYIKFTLEIRARRVESASRCQELQINEDKICYSALRFDPYQNGNEAFEKKLKRVFHARKFN